MCDGRRKAARCINMGAWRADKQTRRKIEMMKKWMAALLAVLMLTGAAALAAADNDV